MLVGPRWQSPAQAQTTLSHPSISPSSDLVRVSDRFETVARLVSPAVVYVEATKPGGSTAGNKTRSVEESGSGLIIRVSGQPNFLVLTNNHVIAQATPDQIAVNLADGRLLRPGNHASYSSWTRSTHGPFPLSTRTPTGSASRPCGLR